MSKEELVEAARIIESITGIPANIARHRMTRKEKQTQRDRVKRFLELPAGLQQAALRYAENTQKSFKGS